MGSVRYANATRIYPGTEDPAVNNLNLEIEDGEFMVLVGPSGCGKSTALRMLAGLEDVNYGQIFIGGADVTQMAPKDRDIAMVFQSYALYPHMTVRDNMGFALKLKGVSKDEIAKRVDSAAKILSLEPFLDRKPAKMSGGQRQRVAMGRAIVREPQVFLMDEPLSNLDAKLRVQTRSEIASLQNRLQVTTVYVTHDQTEAMTMGHRVAVMKLGVLQQVDTPMALYEKPGNVFVATFIGSPAMNMFRVGVSDTGARMGGATLPLGEASFAAARDAGVAEAYLGVRPESMIPVSGEGEGIPVKVDLVEDLGSDSFVYGHTEDATGEARVVMRTASSSAPKLGDAIRVTVMPGQEHVFHPDTEERLES